MQALPMEDTNWLTPTEVADALGVAAVTVRQWAQKGLLPARVTAGGHRRFDAAIVVEFARARGMPIGGVLRESSANRLLVVDDDERFNGFLCEALRSEHPELELSRAFDGFDAGRMVQRHAPAIVLLDIMMPGLDGIEVCRRIKQDPETARTRVIGMTGHHTDSLETRMLSVGAEVLLRKPFALHELFAACGWRTETAMRAAR
ncbi:MAG: response regulator [Pseudomonadota bacterium]